jgi:hypothetical protein
VPRRGNFLVGRQRSWPGTQYIGWRWQRVKMHPNHSHVVGRIGSPTQMARYGEMQGIITVKAGPSRRLPPSIGSSTAATLQHDPFWTLVLSPSHKSISSPGKIPDSGRELITPSSGPHAVTCRSRGRSDLHFISSHLFLARHSSPCLNGWDPLLSRSHSHLVT